MPEGAPPPAASASPTLISGASTTGTAAEVLAGLQGWSGSGSYDGWDHKTFNPATTGVGLVFPHAVTFGAQRLVVQNPSPLPLYVKLNASTSGSTAGNYDYVVPGESILSVRIASVKQIAYAVAALAPTGTNYNVESYLLSGSFAAQGPDLEVTRLSPLGAQVGPPNIAVGSVTGTGASADVVWSTPVGGTDPFQTLDTFVCDNLLLLVSPSTAGTQAQGELFLAVPVVPTGGGGAITVPFNVPAGVAADGPLSPLALPGPFPIGGLEIVGTRVNAPAGSIVNLVVVYH